MERSFSSPADGQDRHARPLPAPGARHFAVIIGSGFSGLGMAIALKRAGIDDFVVLEKAGAVGGTWRDNVYPGCACDVPSHVYSFSFEPNPRWSATYAAQPEIRRYVEHCTDKYDIRRHVRLNAEVTGAEFDEKSGLWTVTTASGESMTARVVMAGLGGLARFTLPRLPGLESFKGRAFHSAAWDTSFDPAGKRIACIGTGASAIQFVPELAKTAAQLHLFQRTPAWVLPRPERPYTELQKLLFERVPGLAFLHRQSIFWQHELRGFAFVSRPAILKWAERLAVRHIHRHIKDPELRRKLTPDYRMGCKRILMSNTYYKALARPNVEVITDGVREVTPSGVVAGDGIERPVDAIVFGTGFDVHDHLGSLRIKGAAGQDLAGLWDERGAEAYLGTTISGFPNLFILIGPNTGLGHNSIIYMIEAQVEHIMKCLDLVRSQPAAYLDVREEVQRAYNDDIQRRLKDAVWATGCASWYIDARGRNTTLWPGLCVQFRRATRAFNAQDYRLTSAAP
jgi:cation diffusion facilitator CzcD-associated flavoprotein CzcO